MSLVGSGREFDEELKVESKYITGETKYKLLKLSHLQNERTRYLSRVTDDLQNPT